jgi:hypothetical protein
LEKRDFALCAGQPKTLSLETATFEKVDETFHAACRNYENGSAPVIKLYHSRFRAKQAEFPYPLPTRIQRHTKPMSGGHGCFYYKVKAASCRAAARARRVPHKKLPVSVKRYRELFFDLL